MTSSKTTLTDYQCVSTGCCIHVAKTEITIDNQHVTKSLQWYEFLPKQPKENTENTQTSYIFLILAGHRMLKWKKHSRLTRYVSPTVYPQAMQQIMAVKMAVMLAVKMAVMSPALSQVLSQDEERNASIDAKVATSSSKVATLDEKVASSEPKVVTSEEKVASPKKKISSEEMAIYILEYCFTWRSMDEIAQFANRDKNYIRNKVLPRLAEKLEKEYPDVPNHPRQRYRTIVKA